MEQATDVNAYIVKFIYSVAHSNILIGISCFAEKSKFSWFGESSFCTTFAEQFEFGWYFFKTKWNRVDCISIECEITI